MEHSVRCGIMYQMTNPVRPISCDLYLDGKFMLAGPLNTADLVFELAEAFRRCYGIKAEPFTAQDNYT